MTKKKKLVLFYHDDPDGWTSGFLAFHRFKTHFDIIGKIPIDYENNIEKYRDLYRDSYVIMLDFSVQPVEKFKQFILDTKELLWIDHHKSSEEMGKELMQDEEIKDKLIAYIESTPYGACMKTYDILYQTNDSDSNDESPPLWVQIVGYYDVWKFPYGKDTQLDVIEYMKSFANRFRDPEDDIWYDLTMIEDPDKLDEYPVVKMGKIIRTAKLNGWLHTLETRSFPGELDGYKVLWVNSGDMNSIPFEKFDEQKEYDIYAPFSVYKKDDSLMVSVSLFSDNDTVDASKIAKKFNGGGHKKAAGFQISYKDFFNNFLPTNPIYEVDSLQHEH